MAIETILLLDMDEFSARSLQFSLERDGYRVIYATNVDEAQKVLRSNDFPDFIIMDVMLPTKEEGWNVLRSFRDITSLPILVFTSDEEVCDKILAFDFGADDYVLKSTDPREIMARIKAISRRVSNDTEARNDREVHFENLSINLSRYEMCVCGKIVKTPPKEQELLFFLATHPNRVFTRDQLLDAVWDFDYGGDSRTVDVHIKRIRAKIDGVSQEWSLRTIWGIGYMFEVESLKQT